MKFKLSSKTVLVLIAAMFILPLVLASLMLTGTIGYKPGSFRNLGELVQPPIQVTWDSHPFLILEDHNESSGMEQLSFGDHWVVLHSVPDPCSPSCMEAITGLRQIHKALGRDQSRVRMVLLIQDAGETDFIDKLRVIYPLFQLAENPGRTIQPVLDEAAGNFSASTSGSSYLIDPIGNIMMFYQAGSDPNYLKKDLKRLLTWSKLDKQQ